MTKLAVEIAADELPATGPATRTSSGLEVERWLRIAGVSLGVDSDHPPLLDELEALYGDCAIEAPDLGTAIVRCRARHEPGSRLLSLGFEGEGLPDPIEIVLGPFRLLRDPSCRIERRPGPVSELFARRGEVERRLLVSDGRTVTVDLDEAPPELLADLVVGVAQRGQPDVLFLHAASVGIDGAGVLLLGPSKRGKSTTALTLAARGHRFLGDDVAPVRPKTRTLLAMPKSVGLRDGPLALRLRGELEKCRRVPSIGPDGAPRSLVRVNDHLPAALRLELPLRFAFLLDGFAARPSVEPFVPAPVELRRFCVVPMTASWSDSAGRDLMRLLAVGHLLSNLSCHRLRLGTPEDSAALVERFVKETPWT